MEQNKGYLGSRTMYRRKKANRYLAAPKLDCEKMWGLTKGLFSYCGAHSHVELVGPCDWHLAKGMSLEILIVTSISRGLRASLLSPPLSFSACLVEEGVVLKVMRDGGDGVWVPANPPWNRVYIWKIKFYCMMSQTFWRFLSQRKIYPDKYIWHEYILFIMCFIVLVIGTLLGCDQRD